MSWLCPSLTQCGLSGALPAVRLRLFDGGGCFLREIDGWRADPAVAAATARVGAFALTAGHSALLTTLAPGAYTAQVSGVANGTGMALIEIYEVP